MTYGTAPETIGVPDVELFAAGTPNTSATTELDGTYLLGGFGPGSYTVTPSKSGDNNGISAFIGPRGELLQTAPQFQYATLTADVLPMSGATPYSVVGNWPVVSIALLIVGGFGWHSFTRRNHR